MLGFLLLPTDHTSQKEDAIAQRIPVTIWFSIGASFGYLQSRPSPPPKIRGEGTGTRQVAPSRELQNPPLIFDSSEGQRDTLLVCPGPRIWQKQPTSTRLLGLDMSFSKPAGTRRSCGRKGQEIGYLNLGKANPVGSLAERSQVPGLPNPWLACLHGSCISGDRLQPRVIRLWHSHPGLQRGVSLTPKPR